MESIKSKCNNFAMLVLLFALFTCFTSVVVAEELHLPRVDPVAADKALDTFQLADGFRIEQVAAEPLVLDPVAMAFDEWGRLYVVEMCDYSEQADDHLGRVRLLVDENGDGKFDSSTVFVEGLSWPTAVACYDGGVFIGAPPKLYYCKDTTGDGVADLQELVVTGFSRTNVQGMLNSFHWGLDNRIHGSTSSTGAELTFPDGSGNTIELRNRDFAMNPRDLTLIATTGGGQHGMSINRWGERFVSANSDHLQAIVFEDRYLSRNPYQSTPPARRSIAADGPQAEVYRSSPVEAWRIARTEMRKAGTAPGALESGGRAAGYFTGATGVTIYEGGLWPERYRGWAFVADVGSNLVHRKVLIPDGVTYRGERVDDESEFLTSTDIWFRPVQMANGPEGALYVADMYREVIEHPHSFPPEIKTLLDLTSGRDRGRIYRVVPDDYQPTAPEPLGAATTAELVAALDDANLWTRSTAARLLYEQQDSSAVPLLQTLAVEAQRPEGRIAALWALEGLSELRPQQLLQGLEDPHPQVRRHAVRLSEPFLADSAELRQQLLLLAEDADIQVRFQLALSLGEWGETENSDHAQALVQLLIREDSNRDIAGAVLTSIHTSAGSVLRELAKEVDWFRKPSARPIVVAIVEQIQRQQRDEDVAILLDLLESSDDRVQGEVKTQLLTALGRPRGESESSLVVKLEQAQEKSAQIQIRTAEKTLDSDSTSPAQLIAAIRVMSLSEFADQRDRLADLLTPTQPAEVQSAVLEVLKTYPAAGVAEVILQAWEQFTPELRRKALELLGQREAWLKQIFAAVEEGTVQLADIDPSHWANWQSHPSSEVREQVVALRETAISSDRQAVFDRYKEVLDQPGDASRGKALFAKHCASCHRLDSVGHELGPNLAAMSNRGAEAILYNILIPNAEVEASFVNYLVVTVDGRMLTGMITGETASSVTLQNANDETHTILRVDIDELRSTGVSIMPDGLEQEIDKSAMADLLAYLSDITAKPSEENP